VGCLINKVTLSLYGRAASKARCEANGPVLGKQRNAGGGAAVQTRRAGRTVASAALVKRSHSGAMPALNRLALTAVRPAERYLICKAAH
jgi:hypothetical protein